MTPLVVAVHGATGAQGSAVVRDLRDAGYTVRAISRRPTELSGVEPVTADLADVDALTRAYSGVDGVVLQLPLVFDESALAHANAVLAALDKVAVPRLVFNLGSAIPDTMVGDPYLDARVLLAKELPNVVDTVALVAPAMTYMENLAAPWTAPSSTDSELRYPLPAELPVPWVAASDVARAIRDLLTAPDPPAIQFVAGPEELTGDQVAAALGGTVRWRAIGPSEFAELIEPYLGAEVAAGIAEAYEESEDAEPPLDPDIIRRGTTTLKEWASRQDWR